MELGVWLRSLGLAQYEAVFREHDIDAEVFPELTEADLAGLGSSLGHRKRLLKAMRALRAEPAVAVPAIDSSHLAERRQLTVMFCDLVGSTALSARLDPEDLREVIGSYQLTVADTVRRFDGFVAKYMGDGVLAYFGYPEAHEDDPEQAIRAALDLIAEISKHSAREPLRVRVGIATGLVVVGDLLGVGAAQEEAVVGETPNLAARLQALAEASAVVISDSTRRQIGSLFEVVDLGLQSLKGFGEQRAWRVVAENRALSRFEALRSGTTPFIGRDEEIELLTRRWQQAKNGSGKVVLISGEAGVGKSRLTAALVEQLRAEPHTRLRYFGSPHHQESPLYPFIDQLERAAGFEREDAPQIKLAKLEGLFAATETPDEDVALIADLLSLPVSEEALPREISPQRKKAKTFAALIGQVERLSARAPVLMVFEDVHWFDPSSRDLLDQTIERVAAWPTLLVATFRPEFQPAWTSHPHVTTVALTRLDRHDTASLVCRIAGEGMLSAEIVDEIIDRTDGVPLFVEELTKAVIETQATGAAASLVAAAPRPGTVVPATLRASLMARLDHLGSAKEVAQAGAAIGRTFDYELLAAVLGWKEPELQTALQRLADAGLLFARGVAPQPTYLFKHALVQDAAYSSLLRSLRQVLHQKIAEALEPRADVAPGLLAYHFTEAALAKRATVYWLKAGQQAAARSAMKEAVSLLRKGLALLPHLRDDADRDQLELDLQLVLGRVLMATLGYAAPAVGESYRRASELYRVLDQPRQLVAVWYGCYLHHLLRGELQAVSECSEQMACLGAEGNDQAVIWLGQRVVGTVEFCRGAFDEARAVLSRCLELYDPTNKPFFARLSPGDLYIVTELWLSRTLACMGCFVEASARREEAMSKARSVEYAYTLAHGLMESCLSLWGIASIEELLRWVEELLRVSQVNEFAMFEAQAKTLRGWCLATMGQHTEGAALVRAGTAAYRTTGSRLFVPFYLTVAAETLAMNGEAMEGLAAIEEGIDLIEETGERWAEAETYRVKAELEHASDCAVAAEESLWRALKVAQCQSAKLWEVRAALSLARLWCQQGKRADARDLLAPVYGWFTEGFDTPDLKDARELLRELQ